MLFIERGRQRVSLLTSHVAHQAGAQLRFCSMKRLGMLLLPPGRDSSPLQVLPPPLPQKIMIAGTLLYVNLGEERQCRIKFLNQGNNTTADTSSNRRPSGRKSNVLTTRPTRLHKRKGKRGRVLTSERTHTTLSPTPMASDRVIFFLKRVVDVPIYLFGMKRLPVIV